MSLINSKIQLFRTTIYWFLFSEAGYFECKISQFSVVISGNSNDYFQILTLIFIPGISLSCLTALLHITLYCDETVSTL